LTSAEIEGDSKWITALGGRSEQQEPQDESPCPPGVPLERAPSRVRLEVAARDEVESTASLLAKVGAGDEEARVRLVVRYRTLLRRWAHGRIPPRARALIDVEGAPDGHHQREQKQREADAEHGQYAAPLVPECVSYDEASNRH